MASSSLLMATPAVAVHHRTHRTGFTYPAMMDQYLHLRRQATDVFELRYQSAIDPSPNRWELCARVLSRRDVVERLSVPW